MSINADKIFQFKITLQHIEPVIWRRVQVPANLSFGDLHWVIQEVMGWENSHLHEFEVLIPGETQKTYIGIPDEEWEQRVLEEEDVPLVDYFSPQLQRIKYIYDFGDNWEHEILLEDILEPDPAVEYPLCLDGERACPPEDCGGPFGYLRILEAFKNPSAAENKTIIAWLDREYDPDAFSIKERLILT